MPGVIKLRPYFLSKGGKAVVIKTAASAFDDSPKPLNVATGQFGQSNPPGSFPQVGVFHRGS